MKPVKHATKSNANMKTGDSFLLSFKIWFKTIEPKHIVDSWNVMWGMTNFLLYSVPWEEYTKLNKLFFLDWFKVQPKLHTVWVGTTFDEERTSQPLKQVCSILYECVYYEWNPYYIHHVGFIMWPIKSVALFHCYSQLLSCGFMA